MKWPYLSLHIVVLNSGILFLFCLSNKLMVDYVIWQVFLVFFLYNDKKVIFNFSKWCLDIRVKWSYLPIVIYE